MELSRRRFDLCKGLPQRRYAINTSDVCWCLYRFSERVFPVA